MVLTTQQVLISNGYLSVEAESGPLALTDLVKNRNLLTVVSNLNYYGFMPSKDTLELLNGLSRDELASFWKKTEPAVKSVTADDRQMDDFVVYQNFPAEVLDMSHCEYWCKQILMYFGFDKDMLRENPVARDPLFENTTLKVLHLADDQSLQGICMALLSNKSRWTAPQLEQVKFLLGELRARNFTSSKAGFRENGIQAISHLMDTVSDHNIIVEDATDILRLAALRSEADISLRQKVKFKNFSRKERRVLCRMLETSKNLESDFAERPALWKTLLRRLHPGDFKYARLSAAYNDLYNGKLQSYASKVEAAIKTKDSGVFGLLKQRPGEFVRRFHHLCSVFGMGAVEAFAEIMPRLTTLQILKMVRYTQTINNRKFLAFPPRSNWNRLQIVANTKKPLQQAGIDLLQEKANAVISERLREILPEGFDVDSRMEDVKLQTNDQELASYGRGTVFQIPDNMKFLRTASYWENTGGTSWFDNGWNFFGENWENKGVICWDHTHMMDTSAAFSGDPVNSSEMKGRACQMIYLYIDKLLAQGIRYAVWNVLCFSNIPFSGATGEVLATLQWGEEPQAGKLYEPSRAQSVFVSHLFPTKVKNIDVALVVQFSVPAPRPQRLDWIRDGVEILRHPGEVPSATVSNGFLAVKGLNSRNHRAQLIGGNEKI